MKLVIRIWFAFSIVSLALYAFTGYTLWIPLQKGGEDALRFMLLLAFHIAGVMAYLINEKGIT